MRALYISGDCYGASDWNTNPNVLSSYLKIGVVNNGATQYCESPIGNTDYKSQWIYCPNLSGTKLRLEMDPSKFDWIVLTEVLVFEYYAV